MFHKWREFYWWVHIHHRTLPSTTQGPGSVLKPSAGCRADVWGYDVTWMKWIHPRMSHESSPQMSFRNLSCGTLGSDPKTHPLPPHTGLSRLSNKFCRHLTFCHQLLFPLFVAKHPNAAWGVSHITSTWATQDTRMKVMERAVEQRRTLST